MTRGEGEASNWLLVSGNGWTCSLSCIRLVRSRYVTITQHTGNGLTYLQSMHWSQPPEPTPCLPEANREGPSEDEQKCASSPQASSSLQEFRRGKALKTTYN